MGLATITLYKTLVMTTLAFIGVFCYKKDIITKEINKNLSDLVLRLLTPILLFHCFQIEFSNELLQGILGSFFLATVSFFVIWGISKITVCRQEKDTACVEHIAIMYSNCGFIGIPMAQGIFGTEGVLYMTAYVALANFLLWSHGIIVMFGKMDVKSLKKVFTSPTILSIVLGLICFFAQIHVPEIIEEPMEMIANMNTPMAMLVAGANIAQSDLKSVFGKVRSYWLSFVKLIIMPVVLIILFKYIPGEPMIKTVMVLASSCPVGVTGSLFALRFGKDAIYASELFAMSTILSIITVPFMMFLCG